MTKADALVNICAYLDPDQRAKLDALTKTINDVQMTQKEQYAKALIIFRAIQDVYGVTTVEGALQQL